jgi:hypothetical protein
MPEFLSKPCTAFQGQHMIAAGPLIDVALAVKAAIASDVNATVLTFDDTTGEVVDLDLRGTAAEIASRLAERSPPSSTPATGPSSGRGRPRLGVVAREVTLLPRHWEWLAAQPGGASGALRRLVEEARRSGGGRDRIRAAQATAYRFMAAMAGDLPGFEEASRALFAGNRDGFMEQIAAWPADLRTYACRLAAAGLDPGTVAAPE